jgi:LemA protein
MAREKSKSGCLGATMVISFIVIILLLLFIPGCSKYNRMVDKQETVDKQWAQVENQYKRRMDLIGNLVETVKGYAAHENETFTQVIEARSKASSIEINADNLDANTMAQFEEAQGGMMEALSKLMVVVEAYPNLKADQHFTKLMDQLTITEDKIAFERDAFNEVAKMYNTYIRKFPNNIIASIFGFDRKGYFEAPEGAENAPEVEF